MPSHKQTVKRKKTSELIGNKIPIARQRYCARGVLMEERRVIYCYHTDYPASNPKKLYFYISIR